MGWVNLGYFLGGLLIIGSMTWLTDQAWLDTRGLSLFYLSSTYVGIFGYAGYYCWNGEASPTIPKIIGAVFTLVAIFISPVSTWSLQRYFDYWFVKTPHILEFSTLAISGGIAIYFIQFPLITFPICFALFSISEIDVAPFIFKNPNISDFSWISVIFGVGMIFCSILMDKYQQVKQAKQDYAFWGYIYGVLAFAGGLSSLRYQVYDQDVPFEWIYLLANLVLSSGTIILQRNVFVIFGGLGVCSSIVDFLFVEATVTENAWISVSFGATLISAGIYNQRANMSSNFPFWAYLFGTSIFFGGMSTLYGFPIYTSQVFKFIFLLVNIGLCLLSLYTQYRIFFLYGVFGASWYVVDVVRQHNNSFWVPIILTLLGLAIIALAIYISHYMKKRKLQKQQKQEVEMLQAPLYYVYYA